MKIEIPGVILLCICWAALPILSERPTTFMSDHDKSLMDAEAYYLHVFVVHIVQREFYY